MRGQCKLGQKRLPAPFCKAKNYELHFQVKKDFWSKKGQGKLCHRPLQIQLLLILCTMIRCQQNLKHMVFRRMRFLTLMRSQSKNQKLLSKIALGEQKQLFWEIHKYLQMVLYDSILLKMISFYLYNIRYQATTLMTFCIGQ